MVDLSEFLKKQSPLYEYIRWNGGVRDQTTEAKVIIRCFNCPPINHFPRLTPENFSQDDPLCRSTLYTIGVLETNQR